MIETVNTPHAGAAQLDACRLLAVGQLSELLGLSERTIWHMAALSAAGIGDDFPQPIRVGPRLKRWRLADVRKYLDRLAGERHP